MKGRSRRADARIKRLAIGSLISVLLVGCSLSAGGDAAGCFPPRSAERAADLGAPSVRRRGRTAALICTCKNTWSHQTPLLDNSTDYRIHLPKSGPLVGGITITGGRRVDIIGGEIDLTYPCSNDASECIGIYIAKNSPGAVFVEGVWIHNTANIGGTCPGGTSITSQTCSTGDGIDVNTTDNRVINVNTITLENIRVDGISGCSGYGDHADVFQPYQAPDDTIQIDRMTGVTNCQGFTLSPDLAYSKWHTFPSSITVENANIDTFVNPYSAMDSGYTWWLTYKTECKSGPLFLTNDYSDEPGIGLGTPSIWPHPGGNEMRRPVLTWGRQLDRRSHSWLDPHREHPPVAISYPLAS